MRPTDKGLCTCVLRLLTLPVLHDLRGRYSRGKERIGVVKGGLWKLWKTREDPGIAELRFDFVSANKNPKNEQCYSLFCSLFCSWYKSTYICTKLSRQRGLIGRLALAAIRSPYKASHLHKTF